MQLCTPLPPGHSTLKHCKQRANLPLPAYKVTAGVERKEDTARNTSQFWGRMLDTAQNWQKHSGNQSCKAALLVMPHITCTAPRENAPRCHLFKSASSRNSAVSKSPKCLQPFLHLIGKVEDSIKNDFKCSSAVTCGGTGDTWSLLGSQHKSGCSMLLVSASLFPSRFHDL